MGKTKGNQGFSLHKLPSSYGLTKQQQLMKDASVACGIRKGMTRSELLEAMNNCVPQFFKQQKEGTVSKESVIKVYHSPHCGPCKQITELINKGQFDSNLEGGLAVEFVDVTSEEGFREISEQGVDSVPTAMYKGRSCKLGIDEENQVVVFECDEGDAGSAGPISPEE